MNHGHVTPNPDGSRARCGGPGGCSKCSDELVRQRLSELSEDTQPPAEAKLGYLDRIQARCEKATPGPWDNRCVEFSNTEIPRHIWSEWGYVAHADGYSKTALPDAEFIAHSRQDVETLLKRLRLAISSLRSECRCSPREPGIPVGHCCDSCRAVSQLEADPEGGA